MERAVDGNLTGQTIHHYDIVALIQSGGQGSVYRGRDRQLYRDVAIKVLAPGGVTNASRRLLITEARTLSRLDHPHVARVYDFITHAERDFMVMEFVPGATLQEFVAGGPLPSSEVLRLGSQLARGLAAAHGANVVHRDIKPANLKITSSGELKILDFGVARLLPPGALLDTVTTTASGMAIVGTVPYMSPEQLRGDKADERSDIFSAGVVLYEMATGRPAFPQRNLARLVEAIQHQDPPPVPAVNPLVPRVLGDIITEAMQKDAAARPQSAAELAGRLEELMPKGRTAARPRVSLESWRAFMPMLGR